MEKNEIQMVVVGIIILLIFFILAYSVETNNTVTAMWEDSQPTEEEEPWQRIDLEKECRSYDANMVVVRISFLGSMHSKSNIICSVELTAEDKFQQKVSRIIKEQMSAVSAVQAAREQVDTAKQDVMAAKIKRFEDIQQGIIDVLESQQ